jgi:hypothetical protein
LSHASAWGPGALEAAGDGVGALAGAEAVLPAEALLLERRASGSGPTYLRPVAGAVRLAEGVAAGDQRHGLLVVHRHAGEGLADVAAAASGSGLPFGPSGLT